MIVGIVFENCSSPETQQTILEMNSYPNGTCLSSSKSINITPRVQQTGDIRVFYWYLDDNHIKSLYPTSLEYIRSLQGVKAIHQFDYSKTDFPNDEYLVNLSEALKQL